MTGLDIVFAVLILLTAVRGALRGFVEECTAMAAVVLGVLGAVFFYKEGALLVRSHLMEGRVLPEIIAFAGIFVGIFVVVKIAGRLLGDIVDRIRLGGADRFLGLLLGLAEGLTLTALALFVLSIPQLTALFRLRPLLDSSLFARYLLPLIGAVRQGGPGV